MENNSGVLSQIGQNRLEQVYINMPEVHFYFSGDREQTEENLAAYIGTEQMELQSLGIFSENGGSVSYYLLLDISASISTGEFEGITDGLSAFCQTVRPQDKVVFLTFGEEVKLLFEMNGEELANGEAADLIAELQNRDQRTLLFEAVHQMAELCKGVSASESMRRVGLVITDGEDIATGKATREEALQILKENGIPVYGFAAESAGRQEKNAFGEFSRSTGGYLTILEEGAEPEGFEAVRKDILQSYEAVFLADSNLVNYELVNTVLQFKTEDEKQQTDILSERWIPDTDAPKIAEIVVEGPKQLRVVFSEPVTGGAAAENFRLAAGEDELVPAFASPGSDGASAVLSFADEIPGGEYRLECSNLRDCSMEENLLEGTASIIIEERAKTETEAGTVLSSKEPEGNWAADYGWIAVLVLFAALAVAAVVFWKKLLKKHAVVTVGGKAVLKEQVSVSHHIALGEKTLEEKPVYFHVFGQKEEIPILIKKSMIVGRSSACELAFDDPALSRQHFALELKNGDIVIRNLSQSGCTEVGGVKLGAGSRSLRSGDEIRAGQLKMRIRW